MIIIGIDPGDNGAIVVLNGKNLYSKKMPDTPADILNFLKKFTNTECVAYMEKLHGMPGMGGTSMFSFGKNNGHLEMALLAAGIRTVMMSPQKWMKTYGLGTKKDCASVTEWKNKLKAKAQQLFPKATVFLWNADAMLIAEYGRKEERQHGL